MLTYAMVMVQNYLASLKREEGQGMAEYALILALIVVGVVLLMGTLGESIETAFTTVESQLSGALAP